jgi:hypothetical protein
VEVVEKEAEAVRAEVEAERVEVEVAAAAAEAVVAAVEAVGSVEAELPDSAHRWTHERCFCRPRASSRARAIRIRKPMVVNWRWRLCALGRANIPVAETGKNKFNTARSRPRHWLGEYHPSTSTPHLDSFPPETSACDRAGRARD